MSQNNQDYIKKNYAFNFSLLMIDALGFGAAYSMMIPTGFVPDVVNQLTNLWFLPPLIISIFFLGVFFSQFITSAFREKESYAKSDVVKWALGERLAILLLFWSLSPDFSSETQLNLFFLFYSLFIFCAGEGNQELINKAGLSKIETQARPLHMVYLRKPNLPEIYVHCIGNDFNLNPSVTVTSHRAQNGDIIWYLGGDIAESGITKSKSEQIKATQELIRNTFPWLNLSDAQWESFYVNRAEANVHRNFRPDDAVIKEDKNILVAWPTKLTLVPSLADKVSEHAARARKGLLEKNIPTAELQAIFEKPTLARARWD